MQDIKRAEQRKIRNERIVQFAMTRQDKAAKLSWFLKVLNSVKLSLQKGLEADLIRLSEVFSQIQVILQTEKELELREKSGRDQVNLLERKQEALLLQLEK